MKGRINGSMANYKEIQDICIETANYFCVFDVNNKSTIGKLSGILALVIYLL